MHSDFCAAKCNIPFQKKKKIHFYLFKSQSTVMVLSSAILFFPHFYQSRLATFFLCLASVLSFQSSNKDVKNIFPVRSASLWTCFWIKRSSLIQVNSRPTSGSVVLHSKTGRREMPVSILGRACWHRRSEFSVAFFETRVNTGLDSLDPHGVHFPCSSRPRSWKFTLILQPNSSKWSGTI